MINSDRQAAISHRRFSSKSVPDLRLSFSSYVLYLYYYYYIRSTRHYIFKVIFDFCKLNISLSPHFVSQNFIIITKFAANLFSHPILYLQIDPFELSFLVIMLPTNHIQNKRVTHSIPNSKCVQGRHVFYCTIFKRCESEQTQFS